jgi:hypothetical protein
MAAMTVPMRTWLRARSDALVDAVLATLAPSLLVVAAGSVGTGVLSFTGLALLAAAILLAAVGFAAFGEEKKILQRR